MSRGSRAYEVDQIPFHQETRNRRRTEHMEPRIIWYGHAAVRIDAGETRIYIDPVHLPHGEPDADLILISHDHPDHCSPRDISTVSSDSTMVFASYPVARLLDPALKVTALAPGDSIRHGEVSVQAIPSYNVDKYGELDEPFHPKNSQYLGFLFEIDDISFYFAGDTDIIPEMDGIGPVDYAFLPVSGGSVMTADEAAEVTKVVQPSIAIPVHYGQPIGSLEDARGFADLVPDQVRVWILPVTSGATKQ
jgi:L-ascorbate metabolism protein UlaG (beta-lactamase superfamily)